MLFSSSSRAWSSTRAVTCLPFSAARARALDDRVSSRCGRASVLIARTWGSSAACSMNWTTAAERLVGVVDQDVLLADRGEDVRRGWQTRRASAARTGLVLEVAEPFELGEAPGSGEVDRAGDLVDVAVLEVEGRAISSWTRNPSSAVSEISSRTAAPTSAGAGSPGWSRAGLDLVLLDRQVAVAGDAEDGMAQHPEPAEECAPGGPITSSSRTNRRRSVAASGSTHQAVEHRGDLEHGVELPRLAGLLARSAGAGSGSCCAGEGTGAPGRSPAA